MTPEELISSFDREIKYLEETYGFNISLTYRKDIEAFRVRVSDGYYQSQHFISKLFVEESWNGVSIIRMTLMNTIQDLINSEEGGV